MTDYLFCSLHFVPITMNETKRHAKDPQGTVVFQTVDPDTQFTQLVLIYRLSVNST